MNNLILAGIIFIGVYSAWLGIEYLVKKFGIDKSLEKAIDEDLKDEEH